VEPSEIPPSVVAEVTNWIYEQPDDHLFKIDARPDFTFTPPKGSFNKAKCSACGEYVFER
jgi:formylmethanofuran dehydrogenase subunit E